MALCCWAVSLRGHTDTILQCVASTVRACARARVCLFSASPFLLSLIPFFMRLCADGRILVALTRKKKSPPTVDHYCNYWPSEHIGWPLTGHAWLWLCSSLFPAIGLCQNLCNESFSWLYLVQKRIIYILPHVLQTEVQKEILGKLKIKIKYMGIYGRYIGFLALTY